MNKWLDIAERVLLTLVLLAAAGFKTVAFLVEGRWDVLAPVLRSYTCVAFMIGVDLFVALSLWSPYRRCGLLGAMGLVVAGLYAYWWGRGAGGQGCGCFGSAILSAWQHVVVAAVVFVTAFRNLARQEGGQRSPVS